jgi:hypothetical protein
MEPGAGQRGACGSVEPRAGEAYSVRATVASSSGHGVLRAGTRKAEDKPPVLKLTLVAVAVGAEGGFPIAGCFVRQHSISRLLQQSGKSSQPKRLVLSVFQQLSCG